MNLSFEICKRIFEDINIYNPNLAGLNSSQLVLPEKYFIKSEFDNIEENMIPDTEYRTEYNKQNKKLVIYFPVFAGKICISDFELSAIFLNSSLDEEKEYSLVFTSLGKTHAIYFSDEKCLFKTLTEKSWINTSIINQANLLIGFENIASLGLDWSKLDDCNEIHIKMLNFLSQQVDK